MDSSLKHDLTFIESAEKNINQRAIASRACGKRAMAPAMPVVAIEIVIMVVEGVEVRYCGKNLRATGEMGESRDNSE